MAAREYGQYCGFARAIEVLGERWALLVLRDLLVGPKRFTDLHRSLPGVPTNVLTARLKELEGAGVIRRRLLPRPSGAIVYELTAYGKELEEIIFALGRWGAKALGDPRPGEVATADSLIMAMRSTFQPDATRGLHLGYQLRFGDITVHARVDDGALVAAEGALAGADLVIEAGPVLKALMAREIGPAEAVENGSVRLTGDPALLERFVEIFRIGSMPTKA